MRLFEFTITIDQYVDDLDAVNSFYGKARDVSLESSGGKTLIHFDREADSLDEALRQAVAEIRGEGWQASEITVEPDCLAPASTA